VHAWGYHIAGGALGLGVPWLVGRVAPAYSTYISGGLGLLALVFGDKLVDMVTQDPDASEKYQDALGTFGAMSVASAVYGFVMGKLSGLSGVPSVDLSSRWAIQGLGQGPMQAAAGLGEYVQASAGLGEYYSTDGSLMPGGELGEYVMRNVNIAGMGDYELVPGYSGMGAVNEGVLPDSNLNQAFDIMEAAAGVGAYASGAGVPTTSDYVPTGQATPVGYSENPDDTGIFDLGGGNGVFGP